MANFDQKVTIEIDVDTDSLDEITKSVSELKGAQQALNSIEKDLDKVESNFSNLTSTIEENRKKWRGYSDDDDPLSEFRGSIRTTRQELGGLRDGLDEEVTVNTDIDEEGFVKNVKKKLDEKLRKDEVEVDVAIAEDIDEANKASVVGQTNDFVKEVETATKDIKLEIDQKVAEPSSLAKGNIQRSANSAVDEITPKVSPEIDLSGVEGEMGAFKEFADTMEVVSQMKEEVSEENKILKKRNEEGEDSALDEAKAFQELVEEGSSLAKVKQSVGRANELLTEKNEQGRESAFRETQAWRKLKEQGWEVGDAMEELGLRQREVADSSRDNRSALRSMTNAVDETGDSMRAANKVGNLFEDGLGSLSVNLGAFTVALRNFLTQVPLLLAALGSLGSAAVGVAGAFLTAGTAIGSAIGAGALAMAQNLDEQYQSIEGTGEALQVMMLGLKDTFLQAIAPLTENAEVMGMFRQFVVGLARDISLVADTFNVLMKRQEDWKSGVLGISGVMDKLGARMREPFEEFVEALSFMFLNLQDEFMDITVGLIDALTGLTRFTTKFAKGITEDTRVLDEFIASLKEMAYVGATLFAGIEPILIGFSSAMQSVASALNSMNDAFVANAITMTLIIAAVNRFGGVIASVMGLIPNLIFGIKSADGSMMAMVKSFGQFTKQHSTLFGGFTSLAEAIENMGEEMSIMAVRSRIAGDQFDDFGSALGEQLRFLIANANSMDELEEGLIDLAAKSNLTKDQLQDFNSELRETGISAQFAESSLDDLDDVDVQNTDLEVKRGLAFGTTAGAADEAARSTGGLGEKLNGLKKYIPIVGSAGLTGAINALGTSAGSAASTLSGMLGPLSLLVAVIGGVLVGLIGNLDQIMANLGATLSAVGSLLSWIGGQLLQIFIDTWNALYDVLVGVFMIIKPFIDLFSSLTGGMGDASGSVDALAGALEYLVDFLGAMLTVVGSLARAIGTLIGTTLESFVIFLQAIIALLVSGLMVAITGIIDFFLDLFGIQGEASSFFNGMIGLIKDLINWIGKIPELSNFAMRTFVKIMQDAFNNVIDSFNLFVKQINKLPFVKFGKVNPVDFGVFGDEGARVSKDEVSSQTDSFMQGLTGKRDKTITYNEDNSTNIDQTVNADPEDQAQLSRVVTDAIAEANSFERRRQGGQ